MLTSQCKIIVIIIYLKRNTRNTQKKIIRKYNWKIKEKN